jgi:hypothetical protein
MKRLDDITLKYHKLANGTVSESRNLRSNARDQELGLPLLNLAVCAGQQGFAVDSVRGVWLVVSGDRADLGTGAVRQ